MTDVKIADRRRVQAMRLVTAVVNAPFLGTAKSRVEGNYRVTDMFRPTPSTWSFIDMDPLFAGDDWFALTDDKFDAQWPLDFALAMPWDEGGKNFRIGYCQSIAARDCRKVARYFSPKMARIGNMDFVDGRYDYGGDLVSLIGSRWVHACDNALTRKSPEQVAQEVERYNNIMAGNIGVALRHRYEWSVIFNFPSCRARFSTDATGALRMFKDRWAEPGSRRSPILHWVARHWRQQRSVPADMIEVRKHLRGRSDFTWHGFPVTIIPAEFEIEQAMAMAG